MRAIVFDLDGTLIDSAPDLQAAANIVLAAEGLPPLTLDRARSFIGNGAGMFVSRMMADAGLPPDPVRHARLLAAFLGEYERTLDKTILFPGVVAMLSQLRAEGWRIGLCTNKPCKVTHAVLSRFGLWFDAVICGDSLPQMKPDPAPLLGTLTALGGPPALYVGDSHVDAECAARARVPFVLYTGGYRDRPAETLEQAACFDHHAELPDLAARLLQPMEVAR